MAALRSVLCCGRANVLSLDRAIELDGLTSRRDNWAGDADAPQAAPGAPQGPMPLVPSLHRLAGPYALQVSIMLKAEGLGSLGLDTPDNRRIALLRAVDLMKQRGVRETHIARSAPMAVALAFIPLPEEVAAVQLGVTKHAQELLEAKTRKWVDPRVDGDLQPSMAYN